MSSSYIAFFLSRSRANNEYFEVSQAQIGSINRISHTLLCVGNFNFLLCRYLSERRSKVEFETNIRNSKEPLSLHRKSTIRRNQIPSISNKINRHVERRRNGG